MSQLNEDRIKRFIVDDSTADSVKAVLMETFMKRHDGDYHSKAAQMMAIEMLNDGWRELEKFKRHGEVERTPRQIGL